MATSPSGVLHALKTVNPGAYAFLLTGLGVFAAAAIVSAFWSNGVQIQTATVIGLVVIVAALLIYICIALVDNPVLKSVLSWFLCVAIMATCCAAAVSILSRGKIVPPVVCWFSANIGRCTGDVQADRAAADVEAISPTESFVSDKPEVIVTGVDPGGALPSVDRSKFNVVVQFGGVITRDAVVQQASQLKGLGWKLDRDTLALGGERTLAASGYNEVRYATGDKDAAVVLAADAQTLNVNGGKRIKVVETPGLKQGTLELWISR